MDGKSFIQPELGSELPVHVGVGKGKSTFLNMSPWHRIGLFSQG